MWKVKMLRELVKRKLTVAVEDVFELFEKTIAEYEEANERRHRALLEAVLNPRLRREKDSLQEWENEEVPPEEPPLKKRKNTGKRTGPRVKAKPSGEDGETPPPQADHSAPVSDVEDLITVTSDGENSGEPSSKNKSLKKDLDLPAVTKPFSCSLCMKSFQTRDCLIEHEREHTKEKSAKNKEKPSTSADHLAPILNVNDSDPDSFSKTKKAKKFKCSPTFSRKEDLDRHVTTPAKQSFNCSVCKTNFQSRDDLISHIREHTKEKPSELHSQPEKPAIRKNDNLTSISSALAKDANKNTSKQKPPEGKEVPSPLEKSAAIPENDDVTSNSSDAADDPKKFPCDKCDKNFVRKEDLDEHLKQHSGAANSKNPGVLQKFYTVKMPTSGSLAQPNGERREDPQSEPESLFAPLSFSDMTADSSDDETSSRDGKERFACTQCQKTFGTQARLQNHLATHTKDRPFACQVCDKKYSRAGDLTKHVRLHADGNAAKDVEKKKKKKKKKSKHLKHTCSRCGKEFTCSSLLAAHLVIHTGEMLENSKKGL
ncbi:zinc finger protein Xfin-like [Corythoichthys intestinalis]|uniref:zinc finger protein Xfin-like n=1 Tax=Corythoichthys intestinalis TaxID=161448 RepID=UPI0025A4FD70|nr:zinc finger protein Xfin-like [Corythoichthys intestinalis]